MRRYSAYTIKKIENELTWEQVLLMLETARKKQEGEQRGSNSGGNNLGYNSNIDVHNYDIQDIAEGKAEISGLNLEQRKVEKSGG